MLKASKRNYGLITPSGAQIWYNCACENNVKAKSTTIDKRKKHKKIRQKKEKHEIHFTKMA